RTAKTQMVVRDQQTVVIGGLMRDAVRQSESKIPILGDIPLLGILFRQTQTTTEKTNLLLFLTPYIIRDQTDLRAIFERKMRERQEFLGRYFVFGDQDYEPPTDYSRTRGLLAEMLNEIEEIDAEQRLLEEARGRPPPAHVPRPPVGIAPEVEGDGENVIIDPGGDDPDQGGTPAITSPQVEIPASDVDVTNPE
ncbi:MAG: type II secretion system protein GspD, partial [Myxococcota bacterium]